MQAGQKFVILFGVIFRSILIFACTLILTHSGFSQAEYDQNKGDLKVLSWNIQMLPNTFRLFSKYLRKKQRLRVPRIAEFCNEADFDLIVFQEVFDRGIRRKLKRLLLSEYPYHVEPVREKGRLINSGVLIVSKLPLKYLDHDVYDKGTGADKWASKACTLVEVRKSNHRIQLAGTHLQSGRDQEDRCCRNYQFHEIRDLLDKHQTREVPVFVVGDMNTRRSNNDEYSTMLEVLDVRDFELDVENPYTIHPNNSWISEAHPCQLDYILCQPNDAEINVRAQSILRPKAKVGEELIDLADHYAVMTKFEIIFNSSASD